MKLVKEAIINIRLLRVLVIKISLCFFFISCSTPNYDYVKINYKVGFSSTLDSLLKNKYDISTRVVDRYYFIEPNGDLELVHYLFLSENHSDTLALIEFRKNNKEPCEIEDTSSFWSYGYPIFEKLDSVRLNRNNFIIKEKGALNYKNYKNYITIQGKFGCFDE